MDAAPRLSPRLLRELGRLDDPRLPMAEIARRLGRRAAVMGLPQPSYETVRAILRTHRRQTRITTTEVLVDVALRARPPDALADHLSGVGVPKR